MTESSDRAAELAAAFEQTRSRLRALEAKYGREPGSVGLLAVSKRKPASDVFAALAAGQAAFGENYLEEALEKMATLDNRLSTLTDTTVSAGTAEGTGSRACPQPEWHFIGGMQSRKTAGIATHFDWVHSIDREKIARRLDAQRPRERAPLNVCLQVNIDGEQSKSGVSPATLPVLAELCASLPGLALRGLMSIPAPRDSLDTQRRVCARLHELYDNLRLSHPEMDTLSMGMSADLEAAIAEGSTLVRVGTALFGARD